MKNLSKAIYSKASTASTFWSLIGGRFFKIRAAGGTPYPYVVFKSVDDDSESESTFSEDVEDVLYQFSIFSAKESSSEVEDIYTALKTVFDKCTLSITGNTFIHMLRQHATLFPDELENPNGTGWVWHYAVDYQIIMEGGV